MVVLLLYMSYDVVWDRVCTFDRAPHTKERLLDFSEWCRVTRHPRVFRRLTGCQRTPRFWGVTIPAVEIGQHKTTQKQSCRTVSFFFFSEMKLKKN